MTDNSTITRLNKVSKRFANGPYVLKDVSLDVDRGEFITFIGPSGCGKSTLLRMVAGLTPITEGSLLIEDQVANEPREDLYLVFQEANLLPWARVLENVELPLKLKGIGSSERRDVAESMVELVGLEDAARQYPRQLSGGMKMRVSIARALSVSPKFLLLDEPFGALDALTRNQLNEDLLKIRQRDPFTAFFVTHSVAEAVFLSTRIVVLTRNPGTISETVDVPCPYPRTADFRESSEYLEILSKTSKALRNSQDAE